MPKVRIGDRVECIRSPDQTTLIKKGEIYKVLEVCEPTVWGAELNIRIIDRNGDEDPGVHFNMAKWFVVLSKPSNEERIAKRMEELNEQSV